MSSLDTDPHNFFLFCFTETQYRSQIQQLDRQQWQSGIQIWMNFKNPFSAVGAAAKLDSRADLNKNWDLSLLVFRDLFVFPMKRKLSVAEMNTIQIPFLKASCCIM